ncbi:MAG: discoidin domain-containing protein, partial [Phycisphaerales bacterium]
QEHHRFCSETVPLLRMEKRTWTRGELFSADVEIAHFGPAAIENARPEWSIKYVDGKELASGRLASQTVPVGNGMILGKIEVPLRDVSAPARLLVTVRLNGTPYANDWDIWVYPSEVDIEPPEGVVIAEDLGADVSDALKAGRKVLLMPPLDSIDSDIPAGFTTIFWNTQWTRGQPPHTLGILCDPEHPALARFPTEFHSDWQWWDLVTKSRFMVLDEFEPEFRPIVQVIDDWNSNRKLGLIFEARIGRGRLLVCSIDLRGNLDESRCPSGVARQMLHSLLKYMDSSAFAPSVAIDIELVRSLLKEPPLLSRAKVEVDSEATGYEGHKAIDGDASTIWHTPWGGGAPGYPHEIRIELREEIDIKGLVYLPRQDMSNGWIARYQVYVSSDGRNWGEPVASGNFKKDGTEKKVLFKKSAKGRFVRFAALSGFDGQIFTSIAELNIIENSEK